MSTRHSDSPISCSTDNSHLSTYNNFQCGSLEDHNNIVVASESHNIACPNHDVAIPHPPSPTHPSSIHLSSSSSVFSNVSNVSSVATDNQSTDPLHKAPAPVVEANQSPAASDAAIPTMTALPYDDDMSIQLNADNMVLAHLPNREKVITLVDSGASDSLVCASFIAQSHYLSRLPKITITPRKFKVGNGQYITARYAIEIPITIHRHKFIVRALAMDTLGGVNLVLGTPALCDVDACLEFKRHKLHFKHSTFVAKLTKSVTLKPKHVKMVSVHARLPTALKDACHFVRTSRFVSQFTSTHMLLQFRNGYASLLVTNDSDTEITLHRDRIFGIIDLRYMTQVYNPIVATSANEDNTTLLYSAATSSHADPTETKYFSTKSAPSMPEPGNSDIPTNISRDDLFARKKDLFPFLEESDPRLRMFDHEIIDRDIAFTHSIIDPDDQQKVKQLLLKYKEALSLHSEIGNTNLTIDFKLTDQTPFYIRPFTVSAAEKPIIDRELGKLVQMGVLQEDHSAYSSPVMLIKKKGTQDLRLVTDFRHLNTKIVKRNLPFPLVKEAMNVIGSAKPTVLSVLDLKQAFFCLNLSPKCQSYCGVTSYFGGKSYKYLKMPMGLSVSPSAFQTHINTILDSVNARDYCLGIMDDLIVFSKSVQEHHKHIESILAALQKHGLKISPAKAKMYRSRVVYMGHEIVIHKNKQGIRPLRDRTEAIRKLPTPTTKRQLKGFIGKVSYLSMYLPKLQLLLKPLHKISSKKAEFIWSHEHQQAFDDILKLLVKPPILALPRSVGLFRLYVDTSRVGVGASLWQIQDGQERLLAYFSKALQKAALHYGITELELTGISIAVSAFRHLLKNVCFEVYTDHASIPLIMKAKHEPSTDRIKRLLEKLSSYAIKVGFRKGSSMVIADYLSRNPVVQDPSFPDDIAFPSYDVAFPMLTRKQSTSQSINVPTVRQTVDSQTSKQVYKRVPPVPASAIPIAPAPPAVPVAPAIPMAPAPPAVTAAPAIPAAPQRPLQPANPVPPIADRPPVPHLLPERTDDLNDTNVDETFDDPPSFLTRKSNPLRIDCEEVMTRHLPKQADIDRLLEKINKSRIQNLHLPYNKRELAKLQSQCPNFKDIYLFILEGILPSPKTAANRILAQSEHFVIVDQVLFKLPTDDTHDLRVVIPQAIVHEILFIYHDSLIACHQGISRMTATLKQKFYFPRMQQMVTNYVRSCQVCQSRKSPVDNERPFHLNIPTNYVPFETVHCDLKVMPPSYHNHKYLMVLVCNITRYVILVPLQSKDAKTVAEAILQRCVFLFGPFKNFVSDQGREWDNSVLAYLFEALKVKQRFVSVGNHQSNKSERFIATVTPLLTSYLTNNGRNWHLFTNAVAYAYNSFASPALANYSPFYLVYMRNPPTVFACPPTSQVALGYQQYADLLKARLEHVGKVMLDVQAQLQHKQAVTQNKKVKNPPTFVAGMLVYVLAPTASSLQIASRKIRMDYVGPFVITEMLDRSHVILRTLDNKKVATIIHVTRLKPAWVRCGQEVVNNITDFKKHNPEIQQILNSITTNFQPNNGFLSVNPLSKDHIDVLETYTPPLKPNLYNILKCRYKVGELQVLLHTKDHINQNVWFPLSQSDRLTSALTNAVSLLKFRITGSLNKFRQFLTS